MRPRRRLLPGLALVALLAALPAPGPALAYEGPTTHAGLTSEALLTSKLHSFLRQRLGLGLGLFTRLELKGAAMDSRTHRLLQFDLEKLDPAGGYRPDSKEGQFAASWAVAGSVLAEAPASRNRHHFLCPADGKGLDNPSPALGWLVGLLATVEGADTVRKFFTGSAFDLTGDPATEWLFNEHNPHSALAFHRELAAAVTGATPALRQHHLAVSLTALGGMLHLLQDMASPTHVRNDFSRGHLQNLGSSTLDRGAAYERYVARRFGKLGLPTQAGPAIERSNLRAFFHSKRWDGLADLTHLGHFSPGTLPPPTPVRGADGEALDPAKIRAQLSGGMAFQKPALGRLNLKCTDRAGCLMRAQDGAPMLAYQVGPEGALRFRLDRRVFGPAARKLLPLARRFSTGFIDHLLRAEVGLTLGSNGGVVVTNRGPALAGGQVRVMAEDDKGKRAVVVDQKLDGPLAAGAPLPELKAEIPKGTVKLVALLQGAEKGTGDPVLATVIVEL